MSAQTTYQDLLIDASKEFPSFRLIPKKDSWIMGVIGAVLLWGTFGRMKSFGQDFCTTLGNTIYTPSRWSEMSWASKYELVRHELVHMRQARRLGMLRYAVMYLLWPVPVWWAWGRVQLELEAYHESFRAMAVVHGPRYLRANRNQLADWLGDTLSGSSYFWTWHDRYFLVRWAERTIDQVVRETPDA